MPSSLSTTRTGRFEASRRPRVATDALSRVAGAPLVGGNRVDLLIDAQANFTRWLEAIQSARTSILFENYMFANDGITRELRDVLSERARAGVRVHVIRDWLGCIGESHDSFWNPLRAAGGEVRTFNPFRFTRPFGWLSRDHRKTLVVDSDVAFVSGVCVDARWLGDPARGIAPWRDTGIAVHGPALRDVALAFAETWAAMGDALPDDLPVLDDAPPAAGDVDLRVIVTTPSTTGLYRLDQLFAAVAERTLWLTDAYFVGTAPYVDALAAAARDGVDVRLLVPATSDVPLVGAISRAGYRALLEAGIRVYEWEGMLHAKTAVIDQSWARVGSSNLNVASWLGNTELDIGIENEAFARRMHAQYEEDLEHATEIVLGARGECAKPSRAGRPSLPAPRATGGSSRSASSALRLANTVGAAVTDRRALGSTEGQILLGGAAVLSGIAAAGIYRPRVLAWPLATVSAWCAIALASRYLELGR